jgi:MFS family permease
MNAQRNIAWIMWGIAAIFYAYQYILRVMPNILMQDIMLKYHLDPTSFGQYSGVYYIGYSLVHIPVGILLDRFGPKKIMPICMVLTVLGMSPLVWSDFWLAPIIGRALVGIGSSSAILGTFKIVRMAFAEEKFAWMLSLAVTIGLIGAIYGGAPVEFLHRYWGLERVVLSAMAAGIVLSIFAYLILPPYEIVAEEEGIGKNITTVFGNGKVMLICVLAGLMVGPLEGFADVWGASFLKTVYGHEASIAAGLPSLMFVGMGFGGPLLSFIAEKTKNYLMVVCVAAVGMAGGFALLLSMPLSVSVLSVLFFVVGMFCAYQILAISYAASCVPAHYAGLTSAVANMVIMIFGYVFHSVIGKIIGIFTLSREGFIYGVSVIPLALVIAAVGYGLLLVGARAKN